MAAARARARPILVGSRQPTEVLFHVPHLLGDQGAAPVSGLARRIEAAFRTRRRESDGRTHGDSASSLITRRRSPPPPISSTFRQRPVPRATRGAPAAYAAVPRAEHGTSAFTTPRSVRAGTPRSRGAPAPAVVLTWSDGRPRCDIHPLRGRTLTIGRGRSADVAVEDQSVSRAHVEIARDGSFWRIRDLGRQRSTACGSTASSFTRTPAPCARARPSCCWCPTRRRSRAPPSSSKMATRWAPRTSARTRSSTSPPRPARPRSSSARPAPETTAAA
ncbi:MAG: FHA domain-containing protein [Deltaproteobacteria bacterium]|nr:FHA domain-containing protein [Deltaproteobacteria bacterium]